MKLFGLDIGTTAIKSVLINEKLEELHSSNTEYEIESHGAFIECDAQKYWELVKAEIDALGIEPDALAVDTQCETLILTDGDGNPVRKAIVWLDNRAADEAEKIREHFGNKKVYEVTGQCEIAAAWPACKLMWVRDNEPEVWAHTKKIFLLEDYILYKLTGKFVTEMTLQSSTIYFDIRNRVWWKEMLDFIGVDESMLPSLHESGQYIGDYGNTKVVTGAMDQVSGAIGAGVIQKGIVSEMTGTTMAIFSPVDEIPPFNPQRALPCHYNYDGKYCVLMWSPAAGLALRWFRDNFCEKFSFDELGAMAETVDIGCDGITFLPYLCGSTMPKYNPDARGSFLGITAEHGRAHFIRSIMESVACMLRQNLEFINASGSEIRSMGGAAKSTVWCQMKADMTGRNIKTLKNKETACLGAAILAGVGTGVFRSVGEAAKMIEAVQTFTPSGNDYSEVYKRYCSADDILNKTEGDKK